MEKDECQKTPMTSSRPCSPERLFNDSSSGNRFPRDAEGYIENGIEISHNITTTQNINTAVDGRPYPERLNPFAADDEYPDDRNPFLDEEERHPDDLDHLIEDNDNEDIVIPDVNEQIYQHEFAVDDEYPDDRNPFSDEVERHPDDLDHLVQDNDYEDIVIPDVNVQLYQDEEHEGDRFENTNSQNAIQEFSPSIITHEKSEFSPSDVELKPLRKAPSPPQNPVHVEKEVFVDLDVAAIKNNEGSTNHSEEYEKDNNESQSNQDIFKEFASPLHEVEKSGGIPSEVSLGTADPEESGGRTSKDKNESHIKYTENRIDNCNTLAPNVKNIKNINGSSVTDNKGFFTPLLSSTENKNDAPSTPALESLRDGSKNNCDVSKTFEPKNIEEYTKEREKINYSASSIPDVENLAESSVKENSGPVVLSVRPSRKKRRAPLPPPLENPKQKIEHSRNAAQTTESNVMKKNSVSPLSPGLRSDGNEIKKNGEFQVNADMTALKPSRPAPPIPSQHLQKPEKRKKGVRGILKRILSRWLYIFTELGTTEEIRGGNIDWHASSPTFLLPASHKQLLEEILTQDAYKYHPLRIVFRRTLIELRKLTAGNNGKIYLTAANHRNAF